MKNIVLILLVVLTSCNFNKAESSDKHILKQVEESKMKGNTTTYYLIRHAEKERSDTYLKDPVLTKEGVKRSENWATVFKDVPFNMVYSTNYNRTKATALPTAISKNLEVEIYDPNNMFDSKFQETTKGKTVLVVGHSNTTPAFANAILKKKKYEDIADDENGALFIITVHSDNSVTSQVLYIN